MNLVSNSVYRNQRVEVDNKRFDKCTFVNCVFVYRGIGMFGFTDCDIQDMHWEFTEYAERTIWVLRHLYHEFDEDGRRIAEYYFETIRSNNL